MEPTSAISGSVRHRRENAVDALYSMGHSLLVRQKVHDAACVCRALLTLAPEDERAWLALGACHEAAGQFDLALDLYGAGGALIATSVRCELARMRLYRVLGRFDQANDALERAVQRAKESSDEAVINRVQMEARTS